MTYPFCDACNMAGVNACLTYGILSLIEKFGKRPY